MATKVDTPVAMETLHVHSTLSTNSPKVSRFQPKSGFVIPKNKLSGSLVPVFRGGGKVDPDNTIKEESNKQVQRKTKWGIDISQDAKVRKGRILAYQTRLEQITEQLKNGALEYGNGQSSKSQTLSSSHDPSKDQLSEENQDLEQLELEKREIIGEILRLNPSYKAPVDFKPLLKEAKVPIPIKVYSGQNFISILLGSESNTQKQLEEETGAKIGVYGTKSDTKETYEITRSDLNEAQTTYKELYVHVSADTFDKVDAAVALIELLVTPASGKTDSTVPTADSTASKSGNMLDLIQEQSTSSYVMMTMGAISEAAAQSMVAPAHSGPVQYQPYPRPWYPTSSPNAPPQPLAGPIFPPISSNSIRFPPSPSNTSSMPPFSGVHPPFGAASPVDAGGCGPSMQVLQQPHNQAFQYQNPSPQFQIPRPPYPTMQPQPIYKLPASFPAASQSLPAGTISAPRATFPQQPVAMASVGLVPSRSLTPLLQPRNSTGWPSAPLTAPPSIRPNLQMVPPVISQERPHSVVPQSSVTTIPSQQNMSAQIVGKPSAFAMSATAFPSQPPALAPPFMPSPSPRPWPIVLQVPSPNSGLSAASPGSVQVPMSTQSVSLPTTPLIPAPSLAPRQPSSQILLTIPSQPPPAVSGPLSRTAPNFSLINSSIASSTSMPPISVLKPPRPTSADFTFQPLVAQAMVPLASLRPNNQPVAQIASQMPQTAARAPPLPNMSQIQLAASQSTLAQSTSQVATGSPHISSFRPALQNQAMPLGAMGPPRPQAVNMFGPSHVPILPTSSSGFGLSSNIPNIRPQPGYPHFPNSHNAAQMTPLNQRGPLAPSFYPAPRVPNMQGLAHTRPPTLLSRNPISPMGQPPGFLVPNQQGGTVGSGPVNQVYDPLLPTSIPPAPLQRKDAPSKSGNPETDSEYEDLMASVGVR